MKSAHGYSFVFLSLSPPPLHLHTTHIFPAVVENLCTRSKQRTWLSEPTRTQTLLQIRQVFKCKKWCSHQILVSQRGQEHAGCNGRRTSEACQGVVLGSSRGKARPHCRKAQRPLWKSPINALLVLLPPGGRALRLRLLNYLLEL